MFAIKRMLAAGASLLGLRAQVGDEFKRPTVNVADYEARAQKMRKNLQLRADIEAERSMFRQTDAHPPEGYPDVRKAQHIITPDQALLSGMQVTKSCAITKFEPYFPDKKFSKRRKRRVVGKYGAWGREVPSYVIVDMGGGKKAMAIHPLALADLLKKLNKHSDVALGV